MGTNKDLRYISVGCLLVRKAESNVPHELWSLPDLHRWHRISPNSKADGDLEWLEGDPLLPTKTQWLLLASKPFSRFSGLIQKLWIRCTFSVSLDDEEQGILRVYLLPDDVARASIDRSNNVLLKARRKLFAELDFSKSTWHGDVGTSRSPSPAPFHTSEVAADDHPSLLHMFNNISSPCPRPDIIRDPDARYLARSLMESNVSGLTTDLYPYQRRSAALMLQREVQPERAIDPRLMKAVDQEGRPWYYNAADCAGMGEPRYYDGVRGGILAEEMGAGKTLICLALILATRHRPSQTPDTHQESQLPRRPRVGSLADMAAACATRNAVPWKLWFGNGEEGDSIEYSKCIEAIRRNPAYYLIRPPSKKIGGRSSMHNLPPRKVYHSYATLVIVPPNLVQQWKQEISKHTSGLKVLVRVGREELPPLEELLDYEIILFSSTRFERSGVIPDSVYGPFVSSYFPNDLGSSLGQIHFKRCIIDEGHRLGNSTSSNKSHLLLAVDRLQISARWIVTGTPSKGLFGVSGIATGLTPGSPDGTESSPRLAESSAEQEKDDLRRIGSIATYYLKVRPWANSATDLGDTPADWSTHIVQPGKSSRGNGQQICLKTTLDSLIVRHRISDVAQLLPTVNEKIVYLDGSYQDKLSVNLFSMMIISNAVQSQRVDRDYFFHPAQRKALMELVSNLRQATFFGGAFLSSEDIDKAVETAEKFLEERNVPISDQDEIVLRDAISIGRLAIKNHLRQLANTFHEIPLYVRNFPGGFGRAWSLDQREGDPVCMSAKVLLALQKYLHPAVDAPHSLQLLFANGQFEARGREEWEKASVQGLESGGSAVGTHSNGKSGATLAGNTRMGRDDKSSSLGSLAKTEQPALESAETGSGTSIAEPLAGTQIIATASAKLSYLVDQLVKYQKDEQIIVFYENDNVAYYLSAMLDVLQIEHLIYSKLITTERRARYVATFNHNPKFRVLLMEVGQAAFGLDMRSASRVYFISPVLNPQVEAQAIGRARRISQKKPVKVETLVLRGSLEEIIVKRRQEMTQAEQRKCKSILDDKPIYEWILNAKIIPFSEEEEELDGPGQTAMLESPQFVFGRGFGRDIAHPDEDLVALPESPKAVSKTTRSARVMTTPAARVTVAAKAEPANVNGDVKDVIFVKKGGATPPVDVEPKQKKRKLPLESEASVNPSTPDMGEGTSVKRAPRRIRFG